MDALADFADRHPGNDGGRPTDWDFLLMNASAASRETEKRRRRDRVKKPGKAGEAKFSGGSKRHDRRTPLTEDECPGGIVRACVRGMFLRHSVHSAAAFMIISWCSSKFRHLIFLCRAKCGKV